MSLGINVVVKLSDLDVTQGLIRVRPFTPVNYVTSRCTEVNASIGSTGNTEMGYNYRLGMNCRLISSQKGHF